MTSTSDNPDSRMVRAKGTSSPGGMSIARICGIEGTSLLVRAHASHLRRENRERSGMLKALASGMTARTIVASVSRSVELRGASSTEILIWEQMVRSGTFILANQFVLSTK
jgi:hypothetical protein